MRYFPEQNDSSFLKEFFKAPWGWRAVPQAAKRREAEAQQSRAHTALAEFSSQQQQQPAHNHVQLQFQGILCPPLNSLTLHTQACLAAVV